MPRPARPRPTNLSHPHYQPPFPTSVSLYTCGEVETGNSQPSASSRSINYHSNRSINYRGHSYHSRETASDGGATSGDTAMECDAELFDVATPSEGHDVEAAA